MPALLLLLGVPRVDEEHFLQASLWHFSPKMAMDCYAQLMVLMPLPLPLSLLLLLLLLLVPLYSQTDWSMRILY